MKIVLSVFFSVVGLLVILAQPLQAQSLDVTAGEAIEGIPIGETASDSAFAPINEVEPVQDEVLEGTVIEVVDTNIQEYSPGQRTIAQQVKVQITSGSLQGKIVDVEFNRLLSEGESELKEQDKVLLNYSQDYSGARVFYVIDYVRRPALILLGLLFVAMVLLVGRWKGVSSLIGLVSSFVIIATVIMPGIQTGYSPLLVALLGAALIIIFTFYLSHGLNEKTTWAVIGTLAALTVTGMLSIVFISMARLTGFASEEVAFLQFLKEGNLDARGLLLASIIIGALGVLDDITISQTSVVLELKKANQKLTPAEVFIRAMNVGKDHIASLVNTLILVYTSSSLPLLLLFTVDQSRGLMDVVNYEIVAEEIVRTLVGSIGLVAAVPLTTFLAAYLGFKKLQQPVSPSSASTTAPSNTPKKEKVTTTNKHRGKTKKSR